MIDEYLKEKIIMYLTDARFYHVREAMKTDNEQEKDDWFKCAEETTEIINILKQQLW